MACGATSLYNLLSRFWAQQKLESPRHCPRYLKSHKDYRIGQVAIFLKLLPPLGQNSCSLGTFRRTQLTKLNVLDKQDLANVQRGLVLCRCYLSGGLGYTYIICILDDAMFKFRCLPMIFT